MGERGLGDGGAGRQMQATDMRVAVTGGQGYDACAGRIEDRKWIRSAFGEVDDVHVVSRLFWEFAPGGDGWSNLQQFVQAAESL